MKICPNGRVPLIVFFRLGPIDVCVDEDVAYVEGGDTLVRAQNLGKRLSNLRVGFDDGNMMFHLRVSYIIKN